MTDLQITSLLTTLRPHFDLSKSRLVTFCVILTGLVAWLAVNMLGPEKRRLVLALDRTNWRLGKSDTNILVLAAITRRFRVPLMWSFLPHGGSRDHWLRCALMDRFVRLFGAGQIEILLTDREFAGGSVPIRVAICYPAWC